MTARGARRQICAALLFLLLYGGEAHAARYGLLLYGAIQQQVDLSYQFNGDQQAISSERHQAVEEYSFRMKYGLGNLNLWRGSLMVGLRTDQSLNSNSRGGSSGLSSRLGLLYDINGVLFDKSVAPAAFAVKSSVTDVSTPFAPNYQIADTLYDFRWVLKNKTLPVSIQYITGTTVTNGQTVDSTRNRNEVYVHATQTGTLAMTNLDLSKVNSNYLAANGEESADNRYEIKFQNNIGWLNDGKSRNFSTGFDYAETSGINNAKYLTASESAQWALGKSLTTGADYTYSTISGDPGDQTHQNGALWLQHQLFKNLLTRLTVRMRNDDYSAGTDQEVGGGANFAYVKELPGDSVLNLGGNVDHAVQHRNLGDDSPRIFQEPHTVTTGPPISLAGANAIVSTIVITNADPLVRRDPYVAGVDYTVVVTGALTQIIVQGDIHIGDSLYITYNIKVDPILKTVTDAYGVNGSLSLFKGAYRVYGSYQDTSQDRTGQVTLAGLTAQSMTRLGVERKWSLLTANAEYIDFNSESDKHQSAQVQALYSNSRREGNVTATVSDLYQWYQPVTLGASVIRRAPDNFFAVSSSYSTVLTSTTNVALNANYQNVSGAGSSDSLSLGGSLHMGLGKLNVLLNGSVGVRRQASVYGYNEVLFVRVTRMF